MIMLRSEISIHLSQTQLFQWIDVEGVTWTVENILLLKLAFRWIIHSLANQKGLDIIRGKVACKGGKHARRVGRKS